MSVLLESIPGKGDRRLNRVLDAAGTEGCPAKRATTTVGIMARTRKTASMMLTMTGTMTMLNFRRVSRGLSVARMDALGCSADRINLHPPAAVA